MNKNLFFYLCIKLSKKNFKFIQIKVMYGAIKHIQFKSYHRENDILRNNNNQLSVLPH